MDRRAFLKAIGSAALLPMLPRRLLADAAPAASGFRRRRPSDAAWPSQAAWKQLNDAVGGNLIPVDFPISALNIDPDGAAAQELCGEFEKSLLHRRSARAHAELRMGRCVGDQAERLCGRGAKCP